MTLTKSDTKRKLVEDDARCIQFSGFKQIPQIPCIDVPGVGSLVQERSKPPTHISGMVDELNHPEEKMC